MDDIKFQKPFWVALLALLTLDLTYGCNEGLPCKLPDGETGICLGGKCIISIPDEVRNNLTFSIVVKYPQLTLQQHGGRGLYIRGSGLGLGWTAGTQLQNIATDTWKIELIYKSDHSGFRCQNCPDKRALTSGKLEYRILIDDSVDMQGGNFAINVPISMTSNYFQQKPEFVACPWFFAKNGTINSYVTIAPYIGGNRTITMYRPPSFQENPYKKYPVALVFDLDPKFAQFLHHLFENPVIQQRTTREVVLVGFADYGDQAGRTELLTPVKGIDFICINGTLLNRCNGCYPPGLNSTEWLRYMRDICGKKVMVGGKGDKTLDFLIDIVLPEVKQLTNMRLLTDRENTCIMGYSFGGLMACYAAWTRPEKIGMASCQSPSFYWPLNDQATADFYVLNVSMKNTTLLHNRLPQKIYLDAGGAETDRPYTLTQGMVRAAKIMDDTDFFKFDKNVWAHVFPGDPHSSLQWAMRVWSATKTLFPVPGGTGIPVNAGAVVPGVPNIIG